jgi:hypothetical protein
MARKGHFGDAAGRWNEINRQLWQEVGNRVPLEAVLKIREVRGLRNGRQGNTEMKREAKILLAIRDGIDWRFAESMEVDHKVAMRNGGEDVASNICLLTQEENGHKGAF